MATLYVSLRRAYALNYHVTPDLFLKSISRVNESRARRYRPFQKLLEDSPVDPRRLESANLTIYADMDAWIWIWEIKKILRLSVARFNTRSIYTMYKRVPVHWTSIRRDRDPRSRATRMNVRLPQVPDFNRRLATPEVVLVCNDR